MNCTYRNCINKIENKRKDAKFCCMKCKRNEYTYIKREKRKEKFEKELIKSILITLNNNDKDLIDLYQSIYN